VKGEFLIGLLAAVIPVCAAHAGLITPGPAEEDDASEHSRCRDRCLLAASQGLTRVRRIRAESSPSQ